MQRFIEVIFAVCIIFACGSRVPNIHKVMITNLDEKPIKRISKSWSNSADGRSFGDSEILEGWGRQDCGFCRTNLTLGSTGVIESPNFPQKYGANVECLWLISSVEGHKVKLSCDTIELESCGMAGGVSPNWRDYLIISPMWTFKKSWVYCGRATKDIKSIVHTSICERLGVTFRSNDNQKQYAGFHCLYEIVA